MLCFEVSMMMSDSDIGDTVLTMDWTNFNIYFRCFMHYETFLSYLNVWLGLHVTVISQLSFERIGHVHCPVKG